LISICNLNIEETEENEKAFNEHYLYFLEKSKPKKFNPFEPDNYLRSMDQEFEESCAVLEENGVFAPKLLTEFEFLSKLKYLEKKYQSLKNATKSL